MAQQLSSVNINLVADTIDYVQKLKMAEKSTETRLRSMESKYKRFGKTAANESKRVGGSLTQIGQSAGYQIQDIAVQLELGTDAMRVFGQQGSQIASAFGPAGAVVGALIAVGAAMWGVTNGSKEAADALTSLEDSIKAKSIEELAGLVGKEAAFAMSVLGESTEAASLAVGDQKEKIADLVDEQIKLDNATRNLKKGVEDGSVSLERAAIISVGLAKDQETLNGKFEDGERVLYFLNGKLDEAREKQAALGTASQISAEKFADIIDAIDEETAALGRSLVQQRVVNAERELGRELSSDELTQIYLAVDALDAETKAIAKRNQESRKGSSSKGASAALKKEREQQRALEQLRQENDAFALERAMKGSKDQIDALQLQYKAKRDALYQSNSEELQQTQEFETRLLQLDQEFADKKVAIEQKLYGDVMSIGVSADQTKYNQIAQKYADEQDLLDEALENKLISEQTYEDRLAVIKEQATLKQREIATKAAEDKAKADTAFLGETSNFLDGLSTSLSNASDESKGIAKLAFLASQGAAASNVIMDTQVAASAANAMAGGGAAGAAAERIEYLKGGAKLTTIVATSIPGFEVGSERIDSDQVAMVHKGERVVQAGINSGLENMITDYNESGSGGSTSVQQINNFNGPVTDEAWFAKRLAKNQDTVAALVRKNDAKYGRGKR